MLHIFSVKHEFGSSSLIKTDLHTYCNNLSYRVDISMVSEYNLFVYRILRDDLTGQVFPHKLHCDS